MLILAIAFGFGLASLPEAKLKPESVVAMVAAFITCIFLAPIAFRDRD